MLDMFIPAESQKLLVFGMCFAGDFAVSEHFVNAPNTAVASDTVRRTLGSTKSDSMNSVMTPTFMPLRSPPNAWR